VHSNSLANRCSACIRAWHTCSSEVCRQHIEPYSSFIASLQHGTIMLIVSADSSSLVTFNYNHRLHQSMTAAAAVAFNLNTQLHIQNAMVCQYLSALYDWATAMQCTSIICHPCGLVIVREEHCLSSNQAR
jgi:glycerol-3-phosphate O-acyltransferase